MSLHELFKTVQEECLPAIWSQGITMSRDGTFVQDVANAEEIILRVILRGRPISPRVTLALRDQDWYCDCGDRNDPCAHVAAAVIVAKKGGLTASAASGAGAVEHGEAAGSTEASGGPGTPNGDASGRVAPGASGFGFGSGAGVGAATRAMAPVPYVSYRFLRHPQGLLFERWLVVGTDETKIGYSLMSAVSGSQSGRLAGPRLAATKADFAIDVILKARGSATGPLDPRTLRQLLGSLESCSSVSLDGQPVRTSTRPAGVRTRLIDDGPGWRIQRYQTTAGSEMLSRGIILEDNVLRPIEPTKLTPQEEDLLAQAGQYYPPEAGPALVTEILPALQKKTPVEVLSTRLPKVIELPPRIQLRLEKEGPEGLSVLANLVYGDPPLAQVNIDNLQLVRLDRSSHDVILRDTAAERQRLQRLHSELQMQVGRRLTLRGEAAVKWVGRLKDWDLTGDGVEAFRPTRVIEPRLQVTERGFNVRFEALPPGGLPSATASGGSGQVDPARMFRAWREGADYVPLIDGGWAPLPKDWFQRYGKRLSELMAAKETASDDLPTYLLPELASFAEELGAPCPERLQRMRRGLADFAGIPESPLPADLRASLRSYQRAGVNWLCFLRNAGLGGLLADDMGLGKTLQALCAVRGRTLVVAPTSVLYNWAAEIEKFRPGLRANVYYGPQRKLDPTADVTLTTYALLRLDLESLAADEWDMVILDEAQTIKNPDSQVARAAHRLAAKFRLALSGTPVENHLDDLWSQFQFVNPGLLGTRDSFQEQYVRPITRGEGTVAERLRSRIKPFILRRLKRSVAPELPPRTETVLHCELSAEEMDLYGALLASTRKEVLAQLESGGGVLAALEVILRLRQACCHRALVPGQRADTSSKVELLVETLEESLEQGHRSLIFSQWTSYLDLIEARLRERGIRTSRIDGSTQNRQALVSEFQAPDGPPVMLISLKAGGTGLTLTAADHIFIMDPWWNPAVEDQAADRAHRIGQQNPVLIHRLVAKDTIEERILLLQKKKTELAAAVLEGGGAALSLTKDDLLDLLR